MTPEQPLPGMVERYSCPRCGRRNAYGGDPYPCTGCGFDGRVGPPQIPMGSRRQATWGTKRGPRR